MLNNENGENENLKNSKEKKGDGIGRVITATGSAQMDACLAIHLDGARQPLEIICQVQGSPFEYTMTKMLYRMEGVETIALESMLGLLQDILAQWQPNPQNVLLQLGLQFQLQQCWLSACKTEQEFLLASASVLREKLRPICEPIVRNHYPNLVEKVLDSLFSLLVDSPTSRKKQQNNSNHQLPITIFQFVSLFRGKQFSAFVENLSHEAWITANLQSGLPSAIRDVMGRLRNVPVVPPLESLRHIGLVLAEQHQELYSPIEKYLRKASTELALDLSACFMCLLENENEASRKGACRALAILGAENSLTCLDFLSHSDCNKSVRMEAEQASLRIRRLLLLRDEQQQVVTKI